MKKDGSIFPVEFSLIPIISRNGNQAAYQAVARDISERKRLQDQLLHAEKLSSIGELVSGVAHELNNPLAVVLGCSELISRAIDLPPHLKTKAKLIISGTNRCARIIENLIGFARKKELYTEYVNVLEILRKALEFHSYNFKVNNIKVVENYETKSSYSMVDPVQLQQVFLNLLNNASDAMSEVKRRGRIHLSAYSNNSYIRFEIVDNGKGIEPEIQNRIFDPFFTTKGVGQGTGLGLSISYGIIKEHGGDLILDKTYQKGAKFVIHLPVRKKESDFGRLVSNRVTLGLKDRKKILVIDSDSDILQMCEEILLDNGYFVEIASEGPQALTLIKSTIYDGIILDIRMPGDIGGKELYYQIKALYPDIAKRIIVMTGDSMKQSMRKFIGKQKIACIAKPFHTKKFLEIINNTILSHYS